MKLDSFILHQINRLPVIKCHVYDDIMTSLVKNWRLSLFLIYLSLSVRSYLPTETWVPRTMIKQNFFFLYRRMGTWKIPKSSTGYILIVMCYELSRLIQSFALRAAICENKDYQTQVYRQDLRGPRIGQDVMLAVILGKRERILRRLEGTSTGLKSRDRAAMLHDKPYKFLVESAWKKKT